MSSVPHAPANDHRIGALMMWAKRVSDKAADSVQRIIAERKRAGRPVTGQEAFDLQVALTAYHRSMFTIQGPELAQKLREQFERFERGAEPAEDEELEEAEA